MVSLVFLTAKTVVGKLNVPAYIADVAQEIWDPPVGTENLNSSLVSKPWLSKCIVLVNSDLSFVTPMYW